MNLLKGKINQKKINQGHSFQVYMEFLDFFLSPVIIKMVKRMLKTFNQI